MKQDHNKSIYGLKIYFYHTQKTEESYKEWKVHNIQDTSYMDFLYLKSMG